MSTLDNSVDIDVVDDPLLRRAKMLVHGISANVTLNVDLDENTGNNDRINSSVLGIKVDSSKNLTDDNSHVFKCGVIHGSSFVTTYSDIRRFCDQGSIISIDDRICQLKGIGGEWIASCVELTCDYDGPTNFDAVLRISKSNSKSSQILTNTGIKPVASESILNAVKDLDSVVCALKKSQSSSNATIARPKADKGTLLRHGLDMTASNSHSEDQKICDELKKTQDRINEWKRKIELKLQEDAILTRHKSNSNHSIKKSDPNFCKKRGNSLPAISPNKTKPASLVHVEIKMKSAKANDSELDNVKKLDELAIAIENQKKIEEQRERAVERVAEFKTKQLEKENFEREKQRQIDEERRLRHEKLPLLRNKFFQMKEKTEQRLQQIAAEETKRQQLSIEAAEIRLKTLADLRGRQKPMAEWFDVVREEPSSELISYRREGSQDRTVSLSMKSGMRDSKISCASFKASDGNDDRRSKSERQYRVKRLPPLPMLSHRKEVSLETEKISNNVRETQESPVNSHHSDLLVYKSSRDDTTKAASSENSCESLKLENRDYDASSILSDITDENESQSKENCMRIEAAQGNSKMKPKKRVKPVWRMRPIEVSPYVPVPLPGLMS